MDAEPCATSAAAAYVELHPHGPRLLLQLTQDRAGLWPAWHPRIILVPANDAFRCDREIGFRCK